MSYHQFTDSAGPYGSFEVFKKEDGFYWWACFPGCYPDGEEVGPFDTEQAAIDHALDS